MTRQKHLLQGKESAEHLAAKYLYMFDSQEKEAQVINYLKTTAETNDSKHNRMKTLMLRRIRHELTDRQRDCISMKYIDGLRAEVIANRLGLSTATVYKHIRKGIERLRRLEYYL